MKVMIAAPYYLPRVGGLENYAAAVARGLKARGWDVVVVCGDVSVRRPSVEVDSGIRVWRLPVWKVVSNTPFDLRWPFWLRQIIRDERPDVINAHAPVVFMVDSVMLAAGRRPVVVTWHAAALFKTQGPAMHALTGLYLPILHMMWGRARQIVAVSPYVKLALGERLAGKVTVVPNAVDIEPVRPAGEGQGLVFVNNLDRSHAWKGLDAILDALVIARDVYGTEVTLTVIGDGDDRSRYEARVAQLGLTKSVTFAGRLVGEPRDRLVRQAAALVHYPTTGNDALPTVMLEAWAEGLAVIVSAIGPMPSLVNNGSTGILVAPNNPQELARAITTAAADPELISAMGQAGRRLVEREYSRSNQIERTAELLEAMV